VLGYWHAHPYLQKLVIDAPIMHTGYDLDEDARRRKYEVRVPILRRTLEESTGRERAYYAYQLACTLHGLGEIDEANALFSAMPWEDLTNECRTYGRNLAALTAESDADSIAHAEDMLRAAPNEPAALFMLGTALADAGETRRALLLMCEAYLWRMAGRRCRMVLRPEFVVEQIARVLGADPETIASPQAIRHIQRRLVPPVSV
jgi:thioredoxin-like negative regulator of GroEL